MKLKITLLLALVALCGHSNGYACTDFLLKAQDQSCVVGRSMEFGAILDTQIQLFPKGQSLQSQAPNNQKGLSWTSRYTYIAMVVLPSNTVVDGFNEQGFSIGALWLPGTTYPQASTNNPNKSLFFADIGSWLLGNFASVEEAKLALHDIHVYAGKVQGFPDIPPIHLSLHDASGNSAVLEFTNGTMKLYDNAVGVLTNSPEFPWHVTNLRNYINLSAVNKGAVNVDGTVLEPTGQGTGLLGIPGDWTPPSRFVRTAVFKQALMQPKDATSAKNAAIHLLNTVDIPYGNIRSANNDGYDFTQWIVIKDLTNKTLSYRTYDDQNIKTIDLMKQQQPVKINLDIKKP